MTSKIVVNNIEADAGVSTVFFNSDIGATDGTLNVDGNLNVDGVITYEDVTSVDSVGLITARAGIHVTGGSVGIGTDNPGTNLDVFGGVRSNNDSENFQVYASNGFTRGLLQVSPGGNGLDIKSTYNNSGYISASTISGGTLYERLRITAAGSVGIGNTASSNIKLDVEGSLRAKAAAYAAPTNGTGLEIYYATGTLNDAPSGYLLSYDRGASAYKKINYDASDHKFRTSGTERLRITSAGKVGIGTESPSTMLEVGSQSQTLAGAITISNGETIAGGSGPLINLKHGPAGGTQRTHQIYSYIGDLRIVADSNENMEFHTGGSESLRITSAGNVSIGGNVGVQTTYPTSATLVGAGSSLIGLYMGDGHMLFSDNLSRSGGYYIPNGINALNAGPVTLNSTMTLDGVWVIV